MARGRQWHFHNNEKIFCLRTQQSEELTRLLISVSDERIKSQLINRSSTTVSLIALQVISKKTLKS
jgi:hypothetical protein